MLVLLVVGKPSFTEEREGLIREHKAESGARRVA